MEKLLEVNSLTTNFYTKRKKKNAIIDDVSFYVGKGEVVGVVGESGCGKSMTALSIMQLLPSNIKMSNDSSIKLMENDLLKYSSKRVRNLRGNDISMIFQEPMTSLNPVMKIGRQVREIIQVHNKSNRDIAKKRAIELLESVGIPDPAKVYGMYPYELSGGMRQRVMISIAMACNPKLMIADEPTTALDVTIQAQILDLMKKVRDDFDTSVLMITHDLGVVSDVCDRVIIMYAGKIVETADVNTLFSNPQHPYTKGLINSLPMMGMGQKRLYSIPGNVPTIENRPKGCKFAPRCEFAMDICRSQEPKTYPVDAHHYSACWLNSPEYTGRREESVYGGTS